MVHDFIARLDYQFGAVAGSDVVMQQFYQITQSKNEKVGNFATCIDIALDKRRVQFLNHVMRQRRGNLLKDHYFYGMNKSLRDSVCYLHNNGAMTHKDLLQEIRMIETEALDPTKVETTAATVVPDLKLVGSGKKWP